jgi:hypothetical protein
MEFWINLLWRLVIVVLVTGAVTFAWTFTSLKLRHLNKPLEWDATSGVIRPWPPLWWVLAAAFGLITLACAAVVVLSVQYADALTVPLAIGYAVGTIFFGFAAWCSALAILPSAYVSWTSDGITGPRSQIRIGRRDIQWANIVRVGRSWLGYYFIEDARGDRVFWSYTYVGSSFLWNVLISKRPEFLDQAKIAVAAHG